MILQSDKKGVPSSPGLASFHDSHFYKKVTFEIMGTAHKKVTFVP